MQTTLAEAIAEMPFNGPSSPGDESEPYPAATDTPRPSEDAQESFTPDTADKAEWVLEKIADARARAARIRENAELIARQHEAEAASLEWRFGPALQAFCRSQIEGTRRKSLRLLNGVIGYRTKPAGVNVTDDAAALAWAQENATEAVIVRLDKKALAGVLLSTGEALPFAALTASEEVFFIK